MLGVGQVEKLGHCVGVRWSQVVEGLGALEDAWGRWSERCSQTPLTGGWQRSRGIQSCISGRAGLGDVSLGYVIITEGKAVCGQPGAETAVALG